MCTVAKDAHQRHDPDVTSSRVNREPGICDSGLGVSSTFHTSCFFLLKLHDSYALNTDVSGNGGEHICSGPIRFNGAAKFLLPSDVVAMVM